MPKIKVKNRQDPTKPIRHVNKNKVIIFRRAKRKKGNSLLSDIALIAFGILCLILLVAYLVSMSGTY